MCKEKQHFIWEIIDKTVMCVFSACIGAISAINNSSVVICLRVEPYLWPLNVFPVLRLMIHIFSQVTFW